MIYFFTEGLDSHVLESYGVEHSRRGFGHTRVRVTLTSFACGAFDDDAPKPVEVDEVGEFFAIAEGAAGGHHGVLKSQVMYFGLKHFVGCWRVLGLEGFRVSGLKGLMVGVLDVDRFDVDMLNVDMF